MSTADTRAETLRLGLAVVIGLAATGFLVGTTDQPAQPAPVPEAAAASREGLREAPTYTELRATPRGAGPGWDVELAELNKLSPSRLDPVDRTGSLEAALATRAARRAYDGAPPTIPHPVDTGGYPECLACHEQGLKLRGHTAPAIPHDQLTSCTQCHVQAVTSVPSGGVEGPGPDAWDNAFVGLASPERGPRAWSVAPPQIPHTTWMRSNCLGCHGVNGSSPMRSDHPSRESCTQCHASPSEGKPAR